MTAVGAMVWHGHACTAAVPALPILDAFAPIGAFARTCSADSLTTAFSTVFGSCSGCRGPPLTHPPLPAAGPAAAAAPRV